MPPNSSTAFMHSRLDALKRRHLLRQVETVDSGQGPWVVVKGRQLLNLSSNNYLGLATHPEVYAACVEAAQEYGCGAGASRLISGTLPLHETLQKRLAGFKGTQTALLYTSGYAANLAVIPALARSGDAVFGDELNHASIIDGCRLSGASYSTYPHRDVNALESALQHLDRQGYKGRRLVVTDTVFSMDGDLAPLPELVSVCEKYDALLMVDEAHATGCVGPGGRGVVAHYGFEERVPVAMSTLSKALGSFGAFVAGDETLHDYLVNVSRGFMFTTALPPPVVAASIAALDVLEREPHMVTRLQENGDYLRQALQGLGFNTMSSETQIVPVLVGDAAKALELARRLREAGVFVVAIRPPTVPPGASRIRASVMATHTREDLDFAIDAFHTVRCDMGIVS